MEKNDINIIDFNKFKNQKYYIYYSIIKYIYKEKNVEKKENNIIFGPKNNLELLNEKHTKEIFMDTTFKVIPKKIRPYKLLILVCLLKILSFPIILYFILSKFLDNVAYEKLFNNLNNNFNFKPTTIYTDFEKNITNPYKK